MENKIPITTLASSIAQTTGKTKKLSEDFIREFFRLVGDNLETGESLKIKGFGTFKVIEVAAREGINVNTGERQEIASYKKVVFNPSKEMASGINAPFEDFETIEMDDDIPDNLLYEDETHETIHNDEDIEEAIGDENLVDAGIIEAGSDEEEEDDIITKEAYSPYMPPVVPVASPPSLTPPVSVEEVTENIKEATEIPPIPETTETSVSSETISTIKPEDLPYTPAFIDDKPKVDTRMSDIRKEDEHYSPSRNYDRNFDRGNDRGYERSYGSNDNRNYERNYDRSYDRSSDRSSFDRNTTERSYDRNSTYDRNAGNYDRSTGSYDRNSVSYDRNSDRRYSRNYERNYDRNYDYEEHKSRFGLGFLIGALCSLIVCVIIFMLGCFFDWWPLNFGSAKKASVENIAPNYNDDSDDSYTYDFESTETEPDQTMIQTEETEQPATTASSDEKKVYDTVTSSRYLTSIARDHYGNSVFWPYIYLENESILGHPDRVSPGTKVAVPKLSKYGIDPSRNSDVTKAKQKAQEIYAKFK